MKKYNVGQPRVMAKETWDRLGIRFEDLSPGSHQKIYVKCEQCGEEFLRERRQLHRLHNCPRYMADSQSKWCSCCAAQLPAASFPVDEAKFDNLSPWCQNCHDKNYANIGFTQSAAMISFGDWLTGIIEAWRDRGIMLSRDDLNYQWASQEGRCYHSDMALSFGGRGGPHSAVLKQLDDSVSSTRTNIVWICEAMESSSKYFHELDFKGGLNPFSVRLECKLIHPDAKLPFRKRTTDAGHDLYSVESVVVAPHECRDIHTGIILSIPPGWYYSIEGRSSMWKSGVSVFPATIDSTYCGECKAALINISEDPYEVKKGDRIAQIIIHRQYDMDISLVRDFGPEYNHRGQAGYGSTGR